MSIYLDRRSLYLYDIVIAEIVWCMAYTREVEGGGGGGGRILPI